MAKRWTIAEATTTRHTGSVAERVDIGRRFPLFATSTPEEILAAMPEHISVRVIEQRLQGTKGSTAVTEEDLDIDAEAEDEDEDDVPSPAVAKRKKNVPAPVLDDEEEDDEEEEVVPQKRRKSAPAAEVAAPTKTGKKTSRRATVFDDED